ncbi:hypothetical protein L7F22_039494 [Adiantum nelumboides]|nr:hypothetical protein [Adiantum nelumboides]
MPNVQQRNEAENGAENQQVIAENQCNEVAIDAPQIEEQGNVENQPVAVMQPAEQRAVFHDVLAENPPATDHWSAIMLARNPVFHAKTKHIEVKYHFIRHVLEDKAIELVKVHTDDNPAHLLTKSLPAERFAYCRQMMGVG